MTMRPATVTASAGLARAAAASCLLAGCAGSGVGLDANGQPLTPGSQGSVTLTADFGSIQTQVLTPICTVCHAGADAPHGLRLDAADSYNLLVGVPSVEVPSLLRVKPGNADDSYMIQKLEGHAAVGARMPLGGPYLSAEVIAVIRQWITAGALAADASAQGASFAIIAVAPAAADVLAESPAQIMIGFNRDLDATRIDPQAVRIERREDDGAAGVVEIVPTQWVVSSVNPQALLLWPLHRLTDGHYRVVMRMPVPWSLEDVAADALDEASSTEALVTFFDVKEAP